MKITKSYLKKVIKEELEEMNLGAYNEPGVSKTATGYTHDGRGNLLWSFNDNTKVIEKKDSSGNDVFYQADQSGNPKKQLQGDEAEEIADIIARARQSGQRNSRMDSAY